MRGLAVPSLYDIGVSADNLLEATWGADPLEYYGGFRTLEYHEQARFKSSLTTNGSITWRTQEAVRVQAPGVGKITLEVGFPEVDWAFLSSIYGWAALQYQAWARGTITLDSHVRQTVVLHTEDVREFWIDNQSYFGGDVYSYRRAPLVLHLDPGAHRVDVRLVRDVRAMGGSGEPTVKVTLEAQISQGGLVASEDKVLVSDIVNGRLASPFASVPIRNEDQNSICVWSVRSTDVRIWSEISAVLINLADDLVEDAVSIAMIDTVPSILVTGQSRPIAFMISLRDRAPSSISFFVDYTFINSQEQLSTKVVHYQLKHLNILSPHKFSFFHPSGIVSYAIIQPPSSETCLISNSGALPIMLALHGAGLEADSDLVRHALDLVPGLCAWVLFPSGVTPWSGDDWRESISCTLQSSHNVSCCEGPQHLLYLI